MSNVIEFRLPKVEDPAEFNVGCVVCDSASFEISMDGTINCSECEYLMGDISELAEAIKERL